MITPVDPCGDEASHASYRAHLRAGEETCPDCRRAHAEYVYAFRGACRRRAYRARTAA